MITRPLLALLLLYLSAGISRAEALFDAKSTYAVIAGVLEWKDPGLASFPKEKRKDRALYEQLGALGVPEAQRTLLLDDAASARAIEDAVRAMVAKAPAGATLILYYAGHGVKDGAGEIVFASSEIRLGKQLAETGLHLSEIPKWFKGFKGRRVLLMADCCYSGGLAETAAELSRAGLQVMALTSAEASNESTRNWTFTQTVLDALAGRALLDRDDNGQLTLGELAAEVRDGMRYREGQRSGYASHGVAESLVVARALPEPDQAGRLDRGEGDYERRDWVRVPQGERREKVVARILGATAPQSRAAPRLYVELFDYATQTRTWIPQASAEPIVFQTWPAGTELRVTWGGKVYDAKVLRVDNGFMWITYPGWDSSWDEWITAPRVVGVKGGENTAKKTCKVEWKGDWYDAVVVSEQGGKSCIHYVGYGNEWDECVPESRIRCD